MPVSLRAGTSLGDGETCGLRSQLELALETRACHPI